MMNGGQDLFLLLTVILAQRCCYSAANEDAKMISDECDKRGFTLPQMHFISCPEDQSVVIGSNVILPCQIQATSAHYTRQWLFKTNILRTDNSADNSSDGSLSIQQVAPVNIGKYTCQITLQNGQSMHRSANLLVLEKPAMPLAVEARLMNDSQPARVEVSWTDGFDGNSPIINYIAQQRTLGSHGLWSDWIAAIEWIAREQRSVSIDNLIPSNTYQFRIVAVNRYGPGVPSDSSNNITMPQQAPSAAPINVAGSARGPQSIMVQWQAPPTDHANGDVLGFLVRYRLADYSHIPWLTQNVSNPLDRTLLLNDLIVWRQYEIQVSAFNHKGAGVFSSSIYVTTQEGIPTDSPSEVNVTVLNSTAVRVQWIPPSQQQIPGVNLGYKIEAWKGNVGIGKASVLLSVLPTNPVRMAAILGGLEKYTAYNITVLCFTGPGDGPRCAALSVVTDQDVPGPLQELYFEEVLFNSVKLVWTPPSEPNGIILGYALQYWSNNDSKQRIERLFDANWTSADIEDLQPSTQYTFELAAKTIVGKGPVTMLSVVSGVPPELPGKPSALQISDVQAYSVRMQFRPGYDGKTIISKWVVEAQEGRQSSWRRLYNESAPKSQVLTVKNLRPDSNYTLRLIAVNVVGESPPSDPSRTFQTLQAAPEAPPSDLSALPAGSSSLSISWTPLPTYYWNAPSGGYKLYYRRLSNSSLPSQAPNATKLISNQPIMVDIKDVTSSDYQLEFLEPFTAYIIVIQSYNVRGTSAHSSEVTATTFPDIPLQVADQLIAESNSSTSIFVQWQQIKSFSSDQILGYRIFYKSVDSLFPNEGVIEVNQESTSTVISGLMKFTQYKIQIAAFNIMGNGPKNEPAAIVRTAADVPGVVREIRFPSISANDFKVQWKHPDNSNGIISEYNLQYLINGSSSPIQQDLPSNVTELSISNLLHHQFYAVQISAKNQVGFGPPAQAIVYTSSSVPKAEPPDRPFQAVQPEARRLFLAWNSHADAVAPVRYFKLNIQKANDVNWEEYAVSFSYSDRYPVAGLSPNDKYRFRVKSINDFGESSWSSDSDWMQTDEDVPTGYVDAVVKPASIDSVVVFWKAPELNSWNSDYLGYRILYRSWPAGDNWLTRELPLGTNVPDQQNVTINYTLNQLSRMTHYMIQVQTFNRKGSGPLARPVFVYVGVTLPDAPVDSFTAEVLSSTQIRLSWAKYQTQKTTISGYKLIYWVDEERKHEDTVPVGAEEVTVTDLEKYSQYNFLIMPFNRAGRGPPVSALATTFEDKPGPVENVQLSDIMMDSINITWSIPSQPNGEIREYLVSYETSQLVENLFNKFTDKTNQTWYFANHLKQNTSYIFSIHASTVAGFGPPVKRQAVLGPQAGSPSAPGKPVISIDNPEVGPVVVEWPPPTSFGNAPVSGYVVQYERLSDDNPAFIGEEWMTLTHVYGEDSRRISIVYSSLSPGEYRLRVLAKNSAGISWPSALSDSLLIRLPTDVQPWYLTWWFLVILALASLLIVLALIALLCFTGRNSKYKYEKHNSTLSLHLADGGVMAYELRSPRDPMNGRPAARSNAKNGNYYDSVAPNLPPPRAANLQSISNIAKNFAVDDDSHSASTVAGCSDNEDEQLQQQQQNELDESSIAQHYLTSGPVQTDTWQRAKHSGQIHYRPASQVSSSNHSQLHHGADLPNSSGLQVQQFSSFV